MSIPKPVPAFQTLPAAAVDEFQSNDPLSGVSAPDFKLFIEGIEVPFANITVSSMANRYPTATLTLGYLPGMETIGEGYFPKVHILYLDYFQDLYYFSQSDLKIGEIVKLKRVYKVLFTGEIWAADFSKRKGEADAETTITYQCRHKNHVMQRIGIGFAKFANDLAGGAAGDSTGSFSQGGLQDFNAGLVALKMLQGINPKSITAEDPSGTLFKPVLGDLDAATQTPTQSLQAIDSGVPIFMYSKTGYDYRSQLKGMPGAVARLLNGMANDGYAFSWQQDAISKIYYPLIRNMKYLESLTGHPIIEEAVESGRQVATSEATPKIYKQVKDASPEDKVATMNPRQVAILDDKADAETKKVIQATVNDATFMAVTSLANSAPSTTPLMGFLSSFYTSLCYEMVTLTSPVMRFSGDFTGDESGPGSAAAPIETVVKPVMPGYFAPRCNVLFPSMYNALSVRTVYDTPTRMVSNWNHPAFGAADMPSMFHLRAPFAVREAVAIKYQGSVSPESLAAGALHPCNTPASHEMGRGINAAYAQVPSWLNLYLNSEDISANETRKQAVWQHMYEYLDYQYGLQVLASKAGGVSGVFNPYIIPGYPMDIIDASPSRPSYHAYCTSVTHSINSGGAVSTSISFEGAQTFEKLYSTESSQILPWLADLLGIGKIKTPGEDSLGVYRYHTLVNASKEARDAADRYYKEVLGVGAAFIDDLSEYKYSYLQPDVQVQASMKDLRAKDWRGAMGAVRRSIQTWENLENVHGFTLISAEMIPERARFVREYPFENGYPDGYTQSGPGALDPSGIPATHSLYLNYNYIVKQSMMLSKQVTPPAFTPLFTPDIFHPDATVNDPNPNSSYTSPVRSGHASWNDGSFFAMARDSARAAHAMEIAGQDTYFSEKYPEYPANLFKQIIRVESSYRPYRESPVGAYGYGQIMPFNNADALKQGLHVGKGSSYNPIHNIKYAAYLLEWFYTYFRRKYPNQTPRACWNNAVVAYNIGQGNVNKVISKSAVDGIQGEGSGVFLYARNPAMVDYFNRVFDTSKKE